MSRVLFVLPLAAALACATLPPLGRTEAEGAFPGECLDGADNDEDGAFDCDDADCVGSTACADGSGPTEGSPGVDPSPGKDTGSAVPIDGDQDGLADDEDCDDANPSAPSVAQDPECDGFYLAENGVTVRCPDVAPGATGLVDEVMYTRRDRAALLTLSLASLDWETTCTSGVTDMSYLFAVAGPGVSSFNAEIEHWDVSAVVSMEALFEGATGFDGSLRHWNVASVQNMDAMFFDADLFNGDISEWNVASVQGMSQMFRSADTFDRFIGAWDVAAVTDMSTMFFEAGAFNQDIGAWDVGAVTDMSYMFRGATAFNQDLGGWCVSQIPFEPLGFSTLAPAWSAPQPEWGSCP